MISGTRRGARTLRSSGQSGNGVGYLFGQRSPYVLALLGNSPKVLLLAVGQFEETWN